MRRRRHLTIAALAAGLVAACGATPAVDKTGEQVTVLHLATIDVLNSNGQSVAPGVFVRELQQVSAGRMKATISLKYEDGEPTAESDLVTAIAADRVDGGWPATRAFAAAGIHGLEPLEAPLLLTSYAAERDIVTGSAGPEFLHTLDRTDVLGLGLVVGPLRRPWATDAPLLSATDWKGTTFRVYNSPVQSAAVRALGGTPVNASYGFPDLVRQGKLRGVETDIAQYELNGYGPLTPMAARNIVLWPRMLVLTINRRRFDQLTGQQQTWVRQAAQEAVQAAIDYAYDENTPAQTLCQQGVRFVDASSVQLTTIRRAVSPVLAELAADPATSDGLNRVQQVAARHPDPDLPDVPLSCRRP